MSEYADELQAQDQRNLIEPDERCRVCGHRYDEHDEGGPCNNSVQGYDHRLQYVVDADCNCEHFRLRDYYFEDSDA